MQLGVLDAGEPVGPAGGVEGVVEPGRHTLVLLRVAEASAASSFSSGIGPLRDMMSGSARGGGSIRTAAAGEPTQTKVGVACRAG